MLNPFIKNISGCGLASFRQEFYLYDSQKAEQHASFLDLLFYLKRRSHTRALQLQAPVAHHRKGQLCTAERAISLLDTTSHVLLENASVLWLQTKRNKSYLFQGPLIKHEMLNCFFLLSALFECGLIHKDPHPLYVLQPVTMTYYHFTTCSRFLLSKRIRASGSYEEGSGRTILLFLWLVTSL